MITFRTTALCQVTCLSGDSHTTLWRWRPPPDGGDHRPFFPSAISVDSTSGHVFVADLYNEKVYWLDCEGRCGGGGGPVLSRGAGLRGGPAAVAVDGARRLLYVADEERTVRVFSFAAADHDRSALTFDRPRSTDDVFC